ncbi:MAG: hypothetical protein AAF074_09085 [Pseudomonadota bacterium]
MSKPWVGWLAFAVLAATVAVSSCQVLSARSVAPEAPLAGAEQGR